MKMEQNSEKKMTNYERKVQARQEAARREKKKSILSTVAALTIVACIAALLIVVPLLKNREKFKEYFKINNESVSELEFVFHRTNLINSNAQYLQIFGMSTAEDLETMMYDQEAGITWSDYFTERAADSILENRALIADAKAKNVSLDIKEDYDAYIAEVKVQAEAMGLTSDAYLNSLFGANEKQLRNIIKDNLSAVAYSEYLSEQKAASDEDAQAEYDANKTKYDSVDYRVLEFAPETEADATDAEIEAAKNDAKAKAEEMLERIKIGEDFETLCATYAPEEERTDYADSETDKSLVTGETYTYSYAPYRDWLFDSARTAGEKSLYTDEENDTYYVLLFEKSYMGDDVLETIKQDLTYNAVIAYIEEISASYTISDPKDNLPTM